MNFRRNLFTRKGWRYVNDVRRYIDVSSRNNDNYVIANSIPKSGTHLLIQILQCLPNIKDLGNFLVSNPSYINREIGPELMARKFNHLYKNELVSAHIKFSTKIESILKDHNAIVYFIYRDPRDIVLSESEYLFKINRFHYMHKHYKKLININDRLELSILGSKDLKYDNIRKRYMDYYEWINSSSTKALKYEDLIKKDKDTYINMILDYYQNISNQKIDTESIKRKISANLVPKKSHTYRKEGKKGWRNVMNQNHKERLKELVGDLLIKLGYEKNYNW